MERVIQSESGTVRSHQEGSLMTEIMEVTAAIPSTARLIACFDGTWNNDRSNTNVSRLFRKIADETCQCPEQGAFTTKASAPGGAKDCAVACSAPVSTATSARALRGSDLNSSFRRCRRSIKTNSS